MKGHDPQRDSFKRGHDPRRHIFTKEECIVGFKILCEKMGGAGSLYKRAQAIRFLYHVDAKRYNNPDLIPQKAIGTHQRKPRGRSR